MLLPYTVVVRVVRLPVATAAGAARTIISTRHLGIMFAYESVSWDCYDCGAAANSTPANPCDTRAEVLVSLMRTHNP